MDYIRWFDSLTLDDIPLVGGKNASLGEMIRTLTPLGVRVPDGFALTAHAYRALLDGPDVRSRLRRALAGIDRNDVESLRAAGERARRIVREAPFPPALLHEVETAYAALSRRYGSEAVDVAVRSSATAEDLPTASFAGQQETYLNVHGVPNLVDITASPCRLIERRGMRMLEVGLTARCATMSCPVEMPPRMPPALFDRNPCGVISSRRAGCRAASRWRSPRRSRRPSPR